MRVRGSAEIRVNPLHCPRNPLALGGWHLCRPSIPQSNTQAPGRAVRRKTIVCFNGRGSSSPCRSHSHRGLRSARWKLLARRGRWHVLWRIRVAVTHRARCLTEAQDSERHLAEIFYRIRGLRMIGHVLHVGAHPDDEDAGLMAFVARKYGARTVYWSATRGEAGQNRVGSHSGDALGIYRTRGPRATRGSRTRRERRLGAPRRLHGCAALG